MRKGIIPESDNGDGTRLRKHVVEAGPVEERGDAHVEETTHSIDEEEFQKLFLVTALVIAEREVFVHKENDNERHARGTGIADIRSNPENLDEEEEERKIHHRPYPPAHGKAETLGEMLTKKWMTQ